MAEASNAESVAIMAAGSMVKIVSLVAKPELNGQVAIVQSWNGARSRYNVMLSSDPSVLLSLKGDNLSSNVGFVEKAKASAYTIRGQAQQMWQDERTQEQIRRTHTSLQNRLPPGIKLEYVGLALVALFLYAVYKLGFSKTFLAISLVAMPVLVLMRDLVDGVRDGPTLMRNFPMRCRETILQSVPFLDGKPWFTNRMASLVVMAFMLFGTKVLFTPIPTNTTPRSNNPSTVSTPPSFDMEQIYKLGFDDATDGKEYGVSLPPSKPHVRMMDEEDDDLSFGGEEPEWVGTTTSTTTPRSKGRFGFSSILSVVFLGNQLRTLAMGPDGRFNARLLVTNFQNLEPWRMGMFAFSCYRLARSLLF
jgi:hypothetical protein